MPNVERREETVQSQPVQETSSIPRQNSQQYHHNPYEEKFHSEFSFISLALGVIGLLLPLFSPLAIVFGIGGLMQTHREHMKGKWMAILGIILGFAGIILILAAIAFGINFLESYLAKFGGLEMLVGEIENF